jgi:glycosyltransferase involved in cell wall biosynthesis
MKLKILMIGSQCCTSGNLKKALERKGHSVTLVYNSTTTDEPRHLIDYPLLWRLPIKKRYGSDYNIVHVHSMNLKKFLLAFPYIITGTPLVCHWHGSDLRISSKSFPVKCLSMRIAKMNFYSTVDLSWWIKVDKSKKMLLNCPVDTDVFKPNDTKKIGTVVFNGGARAYKTHSVEHREMPNYLNQFESAEIHISYGLDDQLYSVLAFECASCGVVVNKFKWMTRKWVIENAGIKVIGDKVESVYKKIVGE